MIGKIEVRPFGSGNDGKTPTPGEWKTVPSLHGDNLLCVQIGDDEQYTTGDMLAADAILASAVKDLLGVAKAYERWEADLILDGEAWNRSDDGLPTLSQESWDRLLEIQAMRNAAVNKALGKS